MFDVTVHYRGTSKSLLVSPDMLIEEIKNQASNLFHVPIFMVRLQILNGDELIEGYARESNLKKGDEIIVTVNELPRVPLSYCSTFLNASSLKGEAEKESSKPAIVVNILFQVLFFTAN